jgi:CubicO group peptidase (beta-lactamase class C family)
MVESGWERVNGEWQGFLEERGDRYRIVMHIDSAENERARVSLDLPDHGALGIALQDISLKDHVLNGKLLAVPTPLRGVFDEDCTSMDGRIRLFGDEISFTLRKDDPAFLKYKFPRLAEDNTPQTEYTYCTPDRLKDGWEVASLQGEDINGEKIDEMMSATLDGQYPLVHSMLLVKDGRLVFEEYCYGQDREQKHTMASVTKSITSILFGIALDQGKIESLDQEIYTFFPKYKGTHWIDQQYDITLRHVLSMTAGLDWNEKLPYTDPRNDNTAMNASDDWLGYILDREMVGVPGEKYEYNSGLSFLLGEVIKQAAGENASQFAEKYLFEPLGISEYTWRVNAQGLCDTGGGLFLRPRDAAKISRMMLDGGRWQGRQIVPEEWVRESTRQQTRPNDYAYGYQWHLKRFTVMNTALRCIQAAGYGGQFLMLFPALDLVVLFTAGDYNGDGGRPYIRLETYILLAVLMGKR